MREWETHGFAREPQVQAWAWLPVSQASSPLEVGPLQGLRFGVKDVIDVRGMPTGYGCADIPADLKYWDATVVAQLRAAGAMPVGKTVTAEFAFVQPGPTRNPHNLEHTPGGSSSGSAAAVAAGMVDFALGTQTGGSMMRPAAYCGVVGFKPSFGLVHRQGMMVTAETLDTIGWFARDVLMSARLLAVVTAAAPIANRLPREVVWVGDWPALDPENTAELERAAHCLASHGVKVRQVQGLAERLNRLAQLHQIVVRYEMARGMLGVQQRFAHALSPVLRQLIKEGLAIDAAVYAAAQAERHRQEAELVNVVTHADLVLAPSAFGAAEVGLKNTGSSLPNRPWSLLGWPCMHLPTTVNAEGLPLGVQLIGKLGKDLQLHGHAASVHSLLLQ